MTLLRFSGRIGTLAGFPAYRPERHTLNQKKGLSFFLVIYENQLHNSVASGAANFLE
jgi:hypothetical protein